ncbi:MAG: hypothetical protein LBF86_04335 [Helicobacteraceae bacterium]|jgi:imidazoleglycerol phosphate synthase glutamine amidotransferase subunit HisH|nr:hypothetical protein [Helicobacteraceae bacterium]
MSIYADAITDIAQETTRAACAGKSEAYAHAYFVKAYNEVFSNSDKYLQKYNDPDEFKACVSRTIEAMLKASAFDPSREQRFLPIYQNILDLLEQNGANDPAENKSSDSQLSAYA